MASKDEWAPGPPALGFATGFCPGARSSPTSAPLFVSSANSDSGIVSNSVRILVVVSGNIQRKSTGCVERSGTAAASARTGNDCTRHSFAPAPYY